MINKLQEKFAMKVALIFFSPFILVATFTGCGGATEKSENKAPIAANLNTAVPTPSATPAIAANLQSNSSVRNSNTDVDDLDRDNRSKAPSSNNTNRRSRDDRRDDDSDRDSDDK